MAQACIHGARECDGCGACWPEPIIIGKCEACREDIQKGETHYNIDGDLIHDDCLTDWASKYRVRGEF